MKFKHFTFLFSRYKKLWAKHQKSLRGLPNWKLALAFKDSKVKGLRSPKTSMSSNSSSSGRSSRSVSECFSPDIILEEPEDVEDDEVKEEKSSIVNCDIST